MYNSTMKSGKAPSQTAKDQLKRIKENIENSATSFRKNNERFHEFFKFVFETAINETQRAALLTTGKPIIEFNVVNAPISRLCGEFSKQMPSITVKPKFGDPVDEQTIMVIEGHIRHILDEANKHNAQYNIYKDQLGGGFSNWKIYTDYAHEYTLDQFIYARRAYEPTLVGYDENAREVTKCDAEFSYEFFPMAMDTFKRLYPKVDTTALDFSVESQDFSWLYTANNKKVVLVCDYYEKKRKEFKLVRVAGHGDMPQEDYEKLVQQWTDEQRSEQLPVVTDSRISTKEVLCRYRLIGSEVLKYEETDFKYQPLIFVDGDSAIIKDAVSTVYKQFTKPYVFHAKGIQQLINFSGQVIGNDFENMVMHKFKVAKESIPQEEEYQDAYKNVQIASTLVYNAFMDNDPDKPVPPPQEIARVPLPPEVLATFTNSMQMLQNILGSYDASLGINDNQLSGVAIVEAATQSNAAAMPYVVSHMQALTQVATVILDLIPKYMNTPRTIPILDKEGNRSYVPINQEGGVTFKYAPNALGVEVEAAPNFAIQKARALNQIMLLMKASPLFAQFMNEEGLPYILSNMEFKGSDILAEKAKEWMQKLQQRMAKQAEQPTPEQMAMEMEKAKMQQKAQEVQVNAMLKGEEIRIDEKNADTDRLRLELDAGMSQGKMAVDIAKAQAEEDRAAADVAIKHMDMKHKEAKDVAELAMKDRQMSHDQAISTIEKKLDHRKQEHEEKKTAMEAKKKPAKASKPKKGNK